MKGRVQENTGSGVPKQVYKFARRWCDAKGFPFEGGRLQAAFLLSREALAE